MKLTKILGAILILLSMAYLGSQIMADEIQAAGIRALAMLLLTILYIVNVKQKQPLFLSFLIIYTIADFFNAATWDVSVLYNKAYEDLYYYVGNGLYILAYLCLLMRMFVGLNVKVAFKKFPFQIILLIGLGIFCVHFLADTTKTEFGPYKYIFELSYNLVVVSLMCLALVNFMYQDDSKSINLLIGSIFIVFSEVLQMAYIYVADFNMLNIIYSLFFVLAFTFFYLSSTLKPTPKIQYNYDV